MPKKRSHGRGGRAGGNVHRRHRHRRGDRAGADQLLTDVRRVLAEDHPLAMLQYASSLVAVLDPRSRDPFQRDPKPEQPSRDDVIQSFLNVPCQETLALVTAMGELLGDDLLRARIRREVASWPFTLPQWLHELSRAEVYRAVEMVHILGDGDDVILGVRLAGGQEFTCVVYIDHNLGTLVKDAFIVPEPIADLVAFMRSKLDDPDTRWSELPLTDARTKVTDAIYVASITVPRIETDTWPGCRALVEWVIRQLPEGGSGYQRPQWSEKKLRSLTERFLASPYGAGLDDPDNRDLLQSLLWFGTDYGPGDPLRWSPVNVEILLADWFPRKIVADASYLAKLPRLLRAFIRFAHAERGIRASLTDETLAAVDQWEPSYQQAIRSPRLQGPEALLAALGVVPDRPFDKREFLLDGLRRAVGGGERLDRLDDAPLPDEPFRWDGIPDDVRGRVAEVLALVDRCCDELFDQECRTACRRFLARVVTGDPAVMRRRSRPETTAAAVVWVVAKVNDLLSLYTGHAGPMAKDLMGHFGLRSGSASQRAAALLAAGGFETDPFWGPSLGSPDYLVSSRRKRIIELRDA